MSPETSPTIFLTGATGAIGSRILEHYLYEGSEVWLLVRPRDGEPARERVEKLLDHGKVPVEMRQRAHVIEGSITEKNFGLEGSDLRHLCKVADQFVHSAAVTHLGATAEECDRANILGTENALSLANRLQKQGRLVRYGHLSSYAASGTAQGGYFEEDALPSAPSFANEYERTKYHSERRVREEMKRGLCAVIFRPSVTVGDTQTGRILSFNFFYQVVKILASGMLSHWPDLRNRSVNIVPVDYVARAIRRGLDGEWPVGKTFHLVSRNGALLHDLFELARSIPSFQLPKLVPLPHWTLEMLNRKEQMLHNVMEQYLLPYLGEIRLETRNAEKLLPLPEINLAFLRRCLDYALKAGYLPRLQEPGAASA